MRVAFCRRGGRSDDGFTLMEMLVVIAIISTLAGLLLSGVVVARRKAAEKRTSMLLVRLAHAIEVYETDFGDYPPGTGDETSGALLYAALRTTSRNGPYIELQRKELEDVDLDGVEEIVDTWGYPIRYVHHRHYDDEPGRGKFRVFSVGPDGEPGTADDLTNWD